MSWLITPQLKSVDGVPIGTSYGGGYVAGFISHTANGVPTHALIVAPRGNGATGTGYTLTANLSQRVDRTATPGINSLFDGVLNTNAMVTAGISNFPAAEFCKNLAIGGFSDWYLPSMLELDIAYFNLKPSTDPNNITASGQNQYAVPARPNLYSASYPNRTSLTAFNTAAEGFVADAHWSSTNQGDTVARLFFFSIGFPGYFFQDVAQRVRAFRRIAL